MRRCLAMLGLLALIAQGCTKKPAYYPLKPTNYPLAAFRVDYQTWDCPELADEADLLQDALAVASEHRASNTTVHLKERAAAVHKARTLKKCSA